MIAEALTERGYKVALAYNGGEGFAAIFKSMPDLILCDINLRQFYHELGEFMIQSPCALIVDDEPEVRAYRNEHSRTRDLASAVVYLRRSSQLWHKAF